MHKTHGPGTVHQCICSKNVLISRNGQNQLVFKFGDWLDSHNEQVKFYSAPEVLAERPADTRSDMFSLGLVLYEIATLQQLLPADAAAVAVDVATVRAQVKAVTQSREEFEATRLGDIRTMDIYHQAAESLLSTETPTKKYAESGHAPGSANNTTDRVQK